MQVVQLLINGSASNTNLNKFVSKDSVCKTISLHANYTCSRRTSSLYRTHLRLEAAEIARTEIDERGFWMLG